MIKPRPKPPALPCVILDAPTLAENVGATARAMANCGLEDLRIARPRGGAAMAVSARARAMAAGADAVLENARIAPALPALMADLHAVAAATARRRDLAKPVLALDEAAAETRRWQAEGKRVGFLFGGERSGLDNEAVARADLLVWIPASAGFASFNLAQAALLVCHAWLRAGAKPPPAPRPRVGDPADHATLEGFFAQLEAALDAAGFLRTPGQRAITLRNLRALFLRAGMSEQETRSMRGVITSLARLDPETLDRKFGGLGGQD